MDKITKIKIRTPKEVIKMVYPIALLNGQLKGLTERKEYCLKGDHSQATEQEREIVKMFLATVDANILALKKAIKKLEQ